MIRRPPRSTRVRSSAASDVYKRQPLNGYQTADYIKTELGLMLPVLITVGTVPTPQELRVIAYAEGIIKKPFIKATTILQINEILERFPERSPAKNDRYSLNYLR